MNHEGLYFAPEQLTVARANAAVAPFDEAWDALRERQPSGPLDFAFRWRLLNEATSADRALGGLLRLANGGLNASGTVERAALLVMALQTFELVRAAPGLDAADLAAWLDYAAEEADRQLAEPDLPLHEALWQNLVRMASAIVLERDEQAQAAAVEFARVVREEIRPQGHLGRVVAGEDGGSLYRQIEATAALVLTAEAGHHAGFPLWDVEARGVSARTAALLPHYYFYTTEKWKWDRGVPVEGVQAHFHRFGGYLEIVHFRSPNRDIQVVLEDLRPLNTPLAGGWTTLSHGLPDKKKRRGLFG